jgi:hypothetical protein
VRLWRKTSLETTKNRMTDSTVFSDYARLLREFIGLSARCEKADPQLQESGFNHTSLSLFAIQYAFNPAYRRLCESQDIHPRDIRHWAEIPAVPTGGFKELELTSLLPEQRQRVFHSSGTTEHHPSRHFHNAESLALYEASLLPWFKAHLSGKEDGFRFLSLTPAPEVAPNSSLVHMFDTVKREFGTADSKFMGRLSEEGNWDLSVEDTAVALRGASESKSPVALLGTAFNFLQLLDGLEERNKNVQLPAGSRVVETGGYKGRTRTLPKPELHQLISQRLGVPDSHIVSEYGMSELSSQAYDAVAGEACSQRVFRFPPWARVRIISPETGLEVGEGGTGLIRVFDLANMRSVMAVQTEDLGVRRGNGFELLGRAPMAEARGCSLMSA